jgi:hypothetical protein
VIDEFLSVIPHSNDAMHRWCLYAALIFIVVSFVNHLIRGQFSKFGTLIAIKQGISGFSFPYSIISILTYTDSSLMTTLSDIPKFLVIAGITLAVIAISSLFKIG